MVRNVIIAVLAIALIATGYWGYREHRDKNAVLQHAENNYQQAYHDLTYYIDKIHDHLGTVLATGSNGTGANDLTEIWRLSALARGDIGQLPLTLLPFNKTAELLSNIGNFSYQASVKNGKQPLKPEDYKQLESLYKQSGTIEKSLRDVQQVIMDHHLRWMDVEMALASKKQPADNQVIDGLRTVDQKVGDFENDWDPAVTRTQLNEWDALKNLTGRPISKKAAQSIVRRFLNIPNGKYVVEPLGKGSGFPAYTVTVRDDRNGNTAVATVARKGGHVVWFVKYRDIKDRRISLYRASNAAGAFLNRHGFKNMALIQSDQYDNVGVFTFARKIGDVWDYPASIRMKVALDNGEVLAFDDRGYLAHQSDASLPLKPAITAETAKKGMNQTIAVQEQHLAIIENDLGNPVLCYEFIGTKGADTYRVLVNAADGRQEKVELMTA